MWHRSWASITAHCIEVERHYTIAVSAWCSMYQFPGCEYIVQVLCGPLGCTFAVYMGIYNYIQLYIHTSSSIYIFLIYKCTFIHFLACLFMYVSSYICIYVSVQMYFCCICVLSYINYPSTNELLHE